jgi:type I restriction enzyme M protein
MAKKNTKKPKTLEQRLWDAADALRGNQEPSEYKHVVLGLVFLKYISDRFEARRRDIGASCRSCGPVSGRRRAKPLASGGIGWPRTRVG